jgi:RNA-directed DNA polymerase
MKESYRKDVANHPDPESCGAGRKARHEALTGADAGVVSNREIPSSGTPTLLSEAEGNMAACDKASTTTDRRGRRPTARIETPDPGTGRSHSPPMDSDGLLGRPAKAKGQAAGMHGHGKSDESIVSKKPANKISKHHLEFAEAELAEIRGPVKRNTDQPGIPRTQSRIHEMSLSSSQY